MAEIIPVIIAEDFWAVKEKIKAIEPYSKWAQLDVADGKFVSNLTWNKPEELETLDTTLNLEAHLMVKKPEEQIEKWFQPGVKRIIFHYEATNKHEEIIAKIKEAGIEAGIALNPETEVEKINDFAGRLDLVLLLSVNPGQTGQKFLEKIIPKIVSLRKKYKDVKIGVDGGINLENAGQIISAGADVLSVGSAVWGKENIKEAIDSFNNL